MAWGGSHRSTPAPSPGLGEEPEGFRRGVTCPLHIQSPPRDPRLASPIPTGPASGCSPALITRRCPFPPSSAFPGPSPAHLPFPSPPPFPILSSPLPSSPLFSESFSLASFLSSSWVKNNQLSGKQQLLLCRPPHTWEPLRIAFCGSQLEPLLSPTAPRPFLPES